MTKRALVLGGGGVTGIAWEIGVVQGLAAHGIDLGAVDEILGTSAGSVVGSILASGTDLAEMANLQRHGEPGEQPFHVDMQRLFAMFSVMFDPSLTPAEARKVAGKLALEADAGDEATYLARFGTRLSGLPWPTRPRLAITGIDAVSGEPVTWDATSGVSLHHAIAASCCVPGIFPPVTIGGRRYIDGGVRSTTNADLVAGADEVVVLAPMIAFTPRWPREREKLGAAKVTLIAPDESAQAAIGQNFMDVTRRAAALDAGLAQAATLVAQLG